MAARLVLKEQSCWKIKCYNEIRKGFTAYSSASVNAGSFNTSSEMLLLYQEHHSSGVHLVPLVNITHKYR